MSSNRLAYYEYISKCKVEMLHDQLPQPLLSRFTTTIKAKSLVAEGSVSSEKEAMLPLARKLNRVLRALEQQGQIGTPSEDRPYFRGKLAMRSTIVEFKLVFFAGEVRREAPFCVGLTGSLENLVHSSLDKDYQSVGGSFLPKVIPILAKHLHEGGDLTSEYVRSCVGPLSKKRIGTVSNQLHLINVMIRTVLRPGAFVYATPETDYEFVAKRLLCGTIHGDRVLLGSPLYVTMA